MLIKYIKSILWRVAKRLSYIEEARCLKVNKRMSPRQVLNEYFKSYCLISESEFVLRESGMHCARPWPEQKCITVSCNARCLSVRMWWNQRPTKHVATAPSRPSSDGTQTRPENESETNWPELFWTPAGTSALWYQVYQHLSQINSLF